MTIRIATHLVGYEFMYDELFNPVAHKFSSLVSKHFVRNYLGELD